MNVIPRDQDNRFRLYARRGEALRIAALAPDLSGVTTALAVLLSEGEWHADERAGILDTHADEAAQGTWILNPWGT